MKLGHEPQMCKDNELLIVLLLYTLYFLDPLGPLFNHVCIYCYLLFYYYEDIIYGRDRANVEARSTPYLVSYILIHT